MPPRVGSIQDGVSFAFFVTLRFFFFFPFAGPSPSADDALAFLGPFL